MANLKFYGKVVEIMEPQTGTSQSTGNQWWSQAFICEELGTNYPSKAHFVLFGKNLNQENVEKVVLGNDVTVSFNINLKDRTNSMTGDRYFNTELRPWKIEQGDTTGDKQQQPKNDGDFTPSFASTGDKLPF
jgi:hypothetical protein